MTSLTESFKKITGTEAKKLWDKEYDLSFNMSKYCGHHRATQTQARCDFWNSSRKCTHKWGVTRFVFLTGHCGGMMLKFLLDNNLASPLQHCRVLNQVGIYIGPENCSRASKQVFTLIEKFFS